MLALLHALLSVAHARCSVAREPVEGGVIVTLRALSEPVTCREVTLTSDQPLHVAGRMLDDVGRSRRLRGAQLGRWPGGGAHVFAPELEVGGALVLRATATGEQLSIAVGDAARLLHGRADARTRVDVERTVLLDPRDPSYGFVLPRRGRTVTRATWRDAAPADAAQPLVLHVPTTAQGYVVTRATGSEGPGHAGGVVLSGDGAARWEEDGVSAIGSAELLPGTFRILHSGVQWALRLPPDATRSDAPGVTEVTLPTGGHVAWRAVEVRVDGRSVPVTGDARRYLEGLDWRFARASLPEPAVPFRLRGMDDRDALLEELYDEASALRGGRLADTRALHPRPLARAWRSGWATSVERALILHRMLMQEKFDVRWYLTGTDPDAASFDGFDEMLLAVVLEGEGGQSRTVWLDPSCGSCAAGEVSPRLVGKALLGTDARPPAARGNLTRSLTLHGDAYTVAVTADGAAGTWLREAVRDAEPEQVERILLARIGVREGHLVSLAGLDEGETVRLEAHTRRAPTRILPDGHPWVGALADVAGVDPSPPVE